jgi:GT2 family glycosyltransferase
LLRGNSSRVLKKKFPHAKLAVVGAGKAELAPGDVAVWVYSGNGHDDAIATQIAPLAESIVLLPGRGAEAAKRRPQLVEELRKLGFSPDYKCDLTEIDSSALRLVRQESSDELDTSAVETAFARMQERIRRLERTLRTRMSELETADRHIGQLEEKALHLKDAKKELKWLHAQNEQLRKSMQRKVGRLVLAPYLVPRKMVRKVANRVRQLRAPARQKEVDLGQDYHRWFERHRATAAELEAMRAQAKTFSPAPLISVITPVFNTPVDWLEAAVNSVVAQVYENWELLLVDDASTSDATLASLAKLGESDPRIRVLRREANGGISAASNDALAVAAGEWVGFLDHDDLLEPDALFHTAKLLQTTAEVDLIYSDEDKIVGDRFDMPFLKPDWAPDLFLSYNYLCHFVTFRRSLVNELGGFRPELDGAQDYDLELRIVEKTQRIHHIPRVLYHWRRTAHSTADNIFRKPPALEAGRKAIQAHTDRIGESAYVTVDWRTQAYWVKREIRETRRISIIIPVRDRIPLLARCIETLVEKTSYRNYDIVIVDNDSESEEAQEYFARTPHRVLRFEGPFNYASMNNFAVEQTETPWLLFLNNDIEVVEADWLSAMAEHVQRAEVGAVGARLLFPDGTVQHAGVVMGVSGTGNHAFYKWGGEESGVHRQLQVVRNYSAVTGACMLTRREVFDEVGGFDEEHLPVNFNDTDLCLRMRRAGYLIVYTPFAKLTHHGSATRSASVRAWEDELMRERYPDVLAHDPYYNPNLSHKTPDFSLGDPRGYERIGR